MRRLAALFLISGLIGCSFEGGGGNAGDGPDAASGADAATDGGAALARRRVISVGAVKATAPISSVPVPVRLSMDSDFSDNAAADGADLLFQLADGTRLPHDVEAIDVSSGVLVAWVTLPTLDPSGGSFEMYYGDGNTAPATGNAWEGIADLVFHFEKITGDSVDHSASGFDGVFAAGEPYDLVAGVVGDAIDATQSSIDLEDATRVDRTDQSFSISAWFDQDQTVADADLLWLKGGFGAPGYQLTAGTGAWRANVEDQDGELVQGVFGDESVLGAAGFVHLVAVVDRTAGELRVYTGGTLADTTALPGTFDSVTSAQSGRVGALTDSLAADGAYDELRAYPRALTADWIAVDHQLGADPSVVTVGRADAAAYPE